MSRRWHPYFLFVAIVFASVSIAHGQAAAEYGAMTAKMGAATAAAAKVPLPTIVIPGGSAPAARKSSAPKPAPAASAPSRLPTADEAAAANRLGLERRAGPEGADISFTSVPEHAQVFIDTQFVGAAPLKLKLAPGHHRVYVTAPNMLASDQFIDVTPKQIREIVLSLNPRAPKRAETH
jgi:hypothetical protein